MSISTLVFLGSIAHAEVGSVPGLAAPAAATVSDTTVTLDCMGAVLPTFAMADAPLPPTVGVLAAARIAAPVGRASFDVAVGRISGIGGDLGVAQGIASFAVVDQAHVRLSPWVRTDVAVIESDGRAVVGLAGLAVDAGGDNVRFDASTTGLIVGEDASPYSGANLALSEIGVRFATGEHSALRVGTISLFPGVDWHTQPHGGKVSLDLGVHSVGAITMGRFALSSTL